jgi:hypothetical protein
MCLVVAPSFESQHITVRCSDVPTSLVWSPSLRFHVNITSQTYTALEEALFGSRPPVYLWEVVPSNQRVIWIELTQPFPQQSLHASTLSFSWQRTL